MAGLQHLTVLLSVVVLLAIVSFIVQRHLRLTARNRPSTTTATTPPVTTNKKTTLLQATGEALPVILFSSSSCQTLNSVIAIPIRPDDNGIPTIEIYIGSPEPQVLRVALDTASSDLVVSGTDCSSCGRVLGKYDASLSETSIALDECSIVTFGTQQDRGCYFEDTLTLAGKCITTCGDLNDTASVAADAVEFKRKIFLVSHDRLRSPYAGNLPRSDYSVFGLCHNDGHPPPILRQLLGGSAQTQFFCILNKEKPWFLLGQLPRTCDVLMFDLPSAYHSEFFAVKCDEVTLGDDILRLLPSTIVIDSGSNFVFLPKQSFHEFSQKYSSGGGDETLSFVFPDFTLELPQESYHDDDGSLMIYPFEGSGDQVILGSLLLSNTVVEFEIESRRVRIGLL
jgi:hypothetical protein